MIKMDIILLCDLSKDDYVEYMKLMFEFTNYKYDLDKEQFIQYIDSNICKIIVLKQNEKIIGAGTIFKINKLHNNPVGLIEDVIISEKYRKYGLGRKIINELVTIGLNEMKCYKIILNCLDKNIEFYKKCGFQQVGVEMKYIC